jgi:hypothetical protein
MRRRLYNALLSFFFFLFMLANIAFPPSQFSCRTPNISGLFHENWIIPFMLVLNMGLSGIVGFWFFVRVFLVMNFIRVMEIIFCAAMTLIV